MRIYGWTIDTWQRAIEWARSAGIDVPDDITFNNAALRALRREWLNRGGPINGPGGVVVL